jgi:hypothetical protein
MNEPFIDFLNTGSHRVTILGYETRILYIFFIRALLRPIVFLVPPPPLLTPCGKDVNRIQYSIVPYPSFDHAPVLLLPTPFPYVLSQSPPNPCHLFLYFIFDIKTKF